MNACNSVVNAIASFEKHTWFSATRGSFYLPSCCFHNMAFDYFCNPTCDNVVREQRSLQRKKKRKKRVFQILQDFMKHHRIDSPIDGTQVWCLYHDFVDSTRRILLPVQLRLLCTINCLRRFVFLENMATCEWT